MPLELLVLTKTNAFKCAPQSHTRLGDRRCATLGFSVSPPSRWVRPKSETSTTCSIGIYADSGDSGVKWGRHALYMKTCDPVDGREDPTDCHALSLTTPSRFAGSGSNVSNLVRKTVRGRSPSYTSIAGESLLLPFFRRPEATRLQVLHRKLHLSPWRRYARSTCDCV
jgi:hypothetical protein